jgi:hypothetical protein
MMATYIYNDGGRCFSGLSFPNKGECAVRAVAIAEQRSYRKVFSEIDEWCLVFYGWYADGARDGVKDFVLREYLSSRGWEYVESRIIPGTGRFIVLFYSPSYGGHAAAVLDGVVHDTFDPFQRFTDCVVDGYFRRRDS